MVLIWQHCKKNNNLFGTFIYKADDTRGNFFEQHCLGTFPLKMGNKFPFGYFRSVVGPVSHLVAL